MPWTLFETSLGTCGVAWNDAGITWFQLPEASAAHTQKRLLARAEEDGARAQSTPTFVTSAIELTRAHLDGRAQDFSAVPLDLSRLGPFVAGVYRALQRVSPGSTVTYGELARIVGSPDAARAVGRAMATNPFPVLVPCHRVVAAGGKPGGFSAYGGLVTKERLLELEGFRKEAVEAPLARSTERGPAPLPLFRAGSDERLPYDIAAARRHLASVDRVLGPHLEREFTLTLESAESTFAALAQSIVYQQLHGKAAATIFGRVRALFPHGRLEPQALLALSDDDLRGAGLSRSKLAAIRDLAEHASAGSIPTAVQLARMDDDAIVDALTKVRGIGRWTVEMLLIFRLGRPDVLPVADYGIKKGFARIFHRGARKSELPSEADLLRRGERWRPFRSVASWYLWRAADS
jgi:methylated-DNA-[protein]-cysteine S-methyltransferase